MTEENIYLFQIKTANVVFYVGEDASNAEVGLTVRRPELTLYLQSGEVGAGGQEAAEEWEAAIKAAVMPVVKTSSSAGQEEPPAAPAPTKEKTVSTVKSSEKEKEGRETEISQAYQIFPDEVLGSGQFGIVYGGVHR